ncbi:pickpocket 22, partial [Carabus blaptoides fortunei]
TDEQRKARLETIRVRTAQARSSETVEQREERLETARSTETSMIEKDNKSSTIDTEYLSMAGYETGLSLVLQSEPADYFYPLNNMEGLNVLIYNPRDYPDTSSGGLVESLIPLQREVFLQIDSVTVEAVQMLKEYPRDVRGCVFSTEDTTSFDTSYYSYSDCLNECKMRSILALCECIPFYMSISKKLPFSTQLCTLSDIVCLNKYKEFLNSKVYLEPLQILNMIY